MVFYSLVTTESTIQIEADRQLKGKVLTVYQAAMRTFTAIIATKIIENHGEKPSENWLNKESYPFHKFLHQLTATTNATKEKSIAIQRLTDLRLLFCYQLHTQELR